MRQVVVNQRGDPVLVADQGDRVAQGLAAVRVERGLHTARRGGAHPFDQSVPVSHRGGAQARYVRVIGRARRADDRGAPRAGELDRDRADPAGCRVDEHRITRTDIELAQRGVRGLA